MISQEMIASLTTTQVFIAHPRPHLQGYDSINLVVKNRVISSHYESILSSVAVDLV